MTDSELTERMRAIQERLEYDTLQGAASPDDVAYLLDGLTALAAKYAAARAELDRYKKVYDAAVHGRREFRAELRSARAELAVLSEQVSDRESDLSYEYDARVYAEAQAEAQAEAPQEIVNGWADHAPDCRARRDVHDNDCTCGYDAALARVRDIPGPPLANTPLDRIVRLGRASLALERAERAYTAWMGSPGPTLAEGQALLARREQASQEYAEALKVAMKGGEG